MYYIYKVANTINGKIYIGQTKNPNKRWSQHCGDARRKPKQHIHRAIAKDGPSNFYFEIIDVGLNRWHADCLEINYISQYDSRNSNKGYNFRPGGHVEEKSEETRRKISEALKGKRTGYKHSEETIKKMSEAAKNMSDEHREKLSIANTGKKLSEKHRAKLSTAKKGKPSPRKGIPMSDEQKKKLSNALKGRTITIIDGKRVWSIT